MEGSQVAQFNLTPQAHRSKSFAAMKYINGYQIKK